MIDIPTDRTEAYLAGDRRRALAEGRELSDRVRGAALFADVSGFTPLTEALAREQGAQRGSEELTAHLNRVFHEVIDQVNRFGGEVIYFGGDAITCWLDADDGARAVACGRAIQRTMERIGAIRTAAGTEVVLSIKVAVAVGAARRFVVGDPDIQLIDVLAGRLIDELAAAEHLAEKGDIILAASALESLGSNVLVSEMRHDRESGASGGVLDRLVVDVEDACPPAPHPPLTEEVVRPWILPAVYERLVTGRGDFLAELRAAYPVFVRFGGIDYDRDPHAAAKLDRFVRRAQRILADLGGNVLHVILGDKGAYLCAVFGVPHAHEDDASRAATAALELMSIERDDGIDQLQIGISHGRIRSGAYGHPKRRTFTCLGDAVNLAARLMSNAPPGHVYVSAEVDAALHERLERVEVGDVRVKGKSEPVHVFAVVGVRRGPARREVRYPLPMVGRDAEMAVFEDAIADLRAGRGRIIGIAAEAGRGKSRLVAEVVRQLAAIDVEVAWGEAQNLGRTTSYMVWRDVWRTLLGVHEDDDEQAQLDTVLRRLEVISPEHARRAPLLNPLIGVRFDETEVTASFDAKLRKTSLESLLVDMLRAHTDRRPIAVVLEDCHWIDALSRDLLEELALAAVSMPVLFVLAYRPGEISAEQLGIDRLPSFRELALSELGAADAHLVLQAKAEQLFGTHVIPANELVSFIVERSQGNPFYIEELINYVHDHRIDPADRAAWRNLDVPDTLLRLVQSRIDMLAEAPRTALKVASVVGATFETPFVRGVYPDLGSLEELEADLDVARRADLVRLDRAEDRAWLFRHVIARDVAYDSLPFAMRGELHRNAGMFVESAGAEAIERDLDLLAYHFLLSDDDSKKREYAVRAGIAAQARYANEAAAEYFRKALPLLAGAERADILRRLGKVLELSGAWAAAEASYREAASLSAQAGDVGGEARAHADLAESLRKQGRFEDARTELLAAGAMFTDAGDESGQALVLHLRGTLASQQGDYTTAAARYQESLEIRERLGERAGVGSLLSNLALVAESQGDLERAQSMNERALEVRESVGDKWAIAVSQNNLGMIALLRHAYAEAQVRFEESMRLATEVGDRWVVAVGHHNLGNALLGLGVTDEAGAEFLQALQAYEDYEDEWSLALLAEDMILLALAKGQVERAEHLLTTTDELRGRLDAPRTPAVATALKEAFEAARRAHQPDHPTGFDLPQTLSEQLRDVAGSPSSEFARVQ